MYSNFLAYDNWMEALRDYGISIQIEKTRDDSITVGIYAANDSHMALKKIGTWICDSFSLIDLLINGPNEEVKSHIPSLAMLSKKR